MTERVAFGLRGLDQVAFAGRGGELAQLDAALERAARFRVPQRVTVCGAAGIGKSRLCRAWRDRLREAGDPAGARAMRVAAPARDGGETYDVVAALVRLRFGLQDARRREPGNDPAPRLSPARLRRSPRGRDVVAARQPDRARGPREPARRVAGAPRAAPGRPGDRGARAGAGTRRRGRAAGDRARGSGSRRRSLTGSLAGAGRRAGGGRAADGRHRAARAPGAASELGRRGEPHPPRPRAAGATGAGGADARHAGRRRPGAGVRRPRGRRVGRQSGAARAAAARLSAARDPDRRRSSGRSGGRARLDDRPRTGRARDHGAHARGGGAETDRRAVRRRARASVARRDAGPGLLDRRGGGAGAARRRAGGRRAGVRAGSGDPRDPADAGRPARSRLPARAARVDDRRGDRVALPERGGARGRARAGGPGADAAAQGVRRAVARESPGQRAAQT